MNLNMHFIKVFFLIQFMLYPVNLLYAQDTTEFKQIPIAGEILLGNDRMNFQTVINKRFPNNTRFVFFSVVNFSADYQNQSYKNDYIGTAVLGYQLLPEFFGSIGASMNSALGFRPILGVHYVHSKPSLMIIVSPGFHITETNNVEILSQIEIKPELNEKYRLYTRLQGFYSHQTTRDLHSRSYINARLGIMKGFCALGIGANWDWYGPNMSFLENYGIFTRLYF